MHYTKSNKEDFIFRSKEILKTSVSFDVIRDAVRNYGYDAVRLAEGEGLSNSLMSSYKEAEKVSVKKKRLFSEKKRKQDEIHKVYMKYLKLARIAFVNDVEAQEVLVLNGVRSRVYEKWVQQVSVFVVIMLDSPRYIDQMSVFGIVKNDIVELRNELKRLEDLNRECHKVTALLKKLNKEVKDKILQVQGWLSRYLKVARIAMGNEKSKELLGI